MYQHKRMVINICFPLLILFVTFVTGIYKEPKINVTNYSSNIVKLAQHITQKTLQSFNIVSHFDTSLFDEQKDLIVHTFRHSPKILLDLKLLDMEVHFAALLPSEMIKSARIIHILWFEKYFDMDYFDHLLTNWIPRYLLVINTSNVSYTEWLKIKSVDQIQYITLLQRPSAGKNYEFITFCPFQRNKRVFRFGEYSINSYGSIRNIFIDRFQSFAGHEFHLATHFDDMPFLYAAKPNKMSQYHKLHFDQILREFEVSDGKDGLAVDMLNALAENLNFSYTLTNQSSDTKWGSFENGTFTGMLKMIQDEGYDFTVNYFGLNSERNANFDHTVPYWNEGYGTSLKLPDSTPKWYSIALPFSPKLWAGIIAAMLVGMIFFWILVSEVVRV